MSTAQKLLLWASLSVLGISLLVPGLVNVLRSGTGTSGLTAASPDAANHVRALNAMMAAVGAGALWACWDLARARPLVLTLGMIMAALVVARLYSLAVDGMPGPATKLYLAIELLFALIFLLWAPPASS